MSAPALDWPTILVDTAEPNPEIDDPGALFWPCVYAPSGVKGKPGAAAALPLQRVKLPTGDYTLEGYADLVTFERKTLADLLGTLFGRGRDSNGNARPEQDRFRRELERMREMNRRGGYARIIVEASIVDVYEHRYRSTVQPISVVNFMNSIDVDYGVPTIWAGDRNGAQLLVGSVLMRIAEQAKGSGEAFKKGCARGVGGFRPWIAAHTGEQIA